MWGGKLVAELDKRLTANDFFANDRNVYTHMIYNYEDPGLHNHAFIEFFYVLDGQCLHFINDKTLKISSGDAYLLTPGDSHRFHKLGTNFLHRDIIFRTEYFRAFCDLYAPDLYEKLLDGTFQKNFSLTNPQLNRLESLTQPLMLDSEANVDLIAGNLCTSILNVVLENNLQNNADNYPAWISRLLSLLSTPENFRTDQQTLTGMFSYRPEYICRTFKKTVGKTVTDYFNEQKMKYAHLLLQSSAYSVEQICERININNVSYFYRLFKKHFNITPREVSPPPANSASARKP